MSSRAAGGVRPTFSDPAEAAELVRTVLEASTEYSIIGQDLEGTIVLWNEGARRIYGYGSSDVVGRNAAMLHTPEDVAAGLPSRIAADTLRDGKWEGVIDRQRSDGTRFAARVVVTPRRDAAGDPIGLLLISKDISDELRLTRELQRSNAQLEEFAYVASHDLAEPLRAIAGFAQLLERRYTGRLDSDADEFIEFIVDGARRMQHLIDDLLDYSRAGGGQLARTHVDCAALVRRVTETFADPIAESGATIRVGDLPTRIGADEGLLERVFQNLIGNALKFHGSAPPVVSIDAERLDDSWRFSVSDNGIGVAAGQEDRIFRMFHRLHARDRYVGTGIGLTVSKTVVERHGGRIWHERAEPEGSRFIFTIADATGSS